MGTRVRSVFGVKTSCQRGVPQDNLHAKKCDQEIKEKQCLGKFGKTGKSDVCCTTWMVHGF